MILALFALLSLILCPRSFAQAEGAPPAEPPAVAPSAPEEPKTPPEPQPKADDAGLALSKADNEVAIALYQKLAAGDGNLFFSPLSISSALAMTYAGAKGTTAAEFETALKYPYKGTELLKAQKNLTDALLGVSQGGPEFVIANSLWPDLETKILGSYLADTMDYFGPLIFPVDYKNDEPKARGKINDWVASTTKDKITDFLTGPLAKDTKFILVNAVYFKGAWKDAFPKDATKDGEFAAPTAKVTVPFMHKEAHFNYLEEPNLQALELLYQGNDISMLVLLPKTGTQTIEELEKSLSADNVAKWLSALKSANVNVTLPRFKITWGSRSVMDVLKDLGLKELFTDAADLSGITGDKSLSVSDVVHKAFVEVNEEGTEAAAATGVMMRATSISLEPTVFTADHPFIFLIVDKETNNIIFIGKVTDPSK
jgi:serpin B